MYTQDYTIQTNKDTPDVNGFVSILTALSRIISITHESCELFHQLSSPVIKNISSLRIIIISTIYIFQFLCF